MEKAEKYFEWLTSFIDCPKFPVKLYTDLLWYLEQQEFYWDRRVPMDENRALDGIDLRKSYSDDIFNGPCTVLEMLIALAKRIDSDIMYEYEAGNRTSEWFWMMIYNLQLEDMDNENINYDYVDYRIYTFLDRNYGENGVGGLFPLESVPTLTHPMATLGGQNEVNLTEIWQQMSYYFTQNYDFLA